MPAFAVGHLHDVVMGPEIKEYLERIDATLERFNGRWLVHGVRPEVREGDWTGDLVVIGFPDLERARSWYESAEYQAIIPLRARNSQGSILLLDGVPEGHRGVDILGDGDQSGSS